MAITTGVAVSHFCKCLDISFRNEDVKKCKILRKHDFKTLIFVSRKNKNNMIIDFRASFSKIKKRCFGQEKGVSNRMWLSRWKGVTRIGETVGEGAA